MRFLTFTSLTTFESCESRDNEIVTDILTTPNTLRENSHGCHEIVNTLRDSVVTIVTDRIFTVCFDPEQHNNLNLRVLDGLVLVRARRWYYSLDPLYTIQNSSS